MKHHVVLLSLATFVLSACGPMQSKMVEGMTDNNRKDLLETKTDDQLCKAYNNTFVQEKTEQQIRVILEKRGVEKCDAHFRVRYITQPKTEQIQVASEDRRTKSAPVITQAVAVKKVPSHMTFFSIELGQPISVPECEKYQGISASKNPICYRPLMRNYYALDYDPKRISFTGTNLSVSTLDGNVEKIVYNTFGLKYQSLDLEELEKKYGKPTFLETRTVKNGFGATFEAMTAIWKLPGLEVYFDSANGRIDSGTVSIKTDKVLKREKTNRQSEDLQKMHM